MNVQVIVPWRSRGCPHREAAWALVQDNWTGWEVHTADDGLEPFSRAASINLAVMEHPADVLVVADADILIATDQVRAAVELAAWSPGMVVAFDRWAHLTESGTQYVLDGFLGSWEPFIDVTLDKTVSCCVALSRETWELSGGFDPRFRAWGFEDVQLEIVCATLAAPTRWIPGSAYHLFHKTEQERPPENLAMLNEYLALRDDPEAMRAHIAKVHSPMLARP